MIVLLPKSGLIMTGGALNPTSIETFPADASCDIPPFPAPGFFYNFFCYFHFFPAQGEHATASLPSTTPLSPAVGRHIALEHLVSLGGVENQTGLITSL